MLDQRWRAEVEKGLRPLGNRLRKSGFTANQITLLGLAASLFTGIAIATGHFFYAAVGMAVCGVTDVLDGAVAKSGGTAGPGGAFFDSVADRVSDGFVLGGAAWYYSGQQSRLSVLAFAVAGLSYLVSYERSKAESLGLDCKGGLMERAERMVILGLGLAFGWLTLALWVLLVLTGITVVQRFVKVWDQVPSGPDGSGDGQDTGAGPDPSGQPGPSVTAGEEGDGDPSPRWRAGARPPGEPRPPGERGRLSARLLSSRPPRPRAHGPHQDGPEGTRWERWRESLEGAGSGDRRFRGRNRP